jgi:hypothetical protein
MQGLRKFNPNRWNGGVARALFESLILNWGGYSRSSKECPVSPKIHSSLTACVVGVALAAAIAVPGVAAAGSDNPGIATPHRIHGRHPVHQWHHFIQRSPPIYGYAALPPGAMVMPGYVFVPGRGILGEACNLPTSTCPNTERDTQ